MANWVTANPQKFSPPKSTTCIFKQFTLKFFPRKINPLYGALPPLTAWYIHLFFLLFSYFQQHFTIWSKTSAHELADTKFTPSMITVIIGMVFYDWKFFIIRFTDTILTCVPSPGTNIAHVILP